MLPTAANGQPVGATHTRSGEDVHNAFGIAVLTPAGKGIAAVIVFGEPDLAARFGFPPVLPAGSG